MIIGPHPEVPFEFELFRIKSLWAEVLRRAILDWSQYYAANDVHRKRKFWDAHQWIFDESLEEEFPGFVSICHHLNLDPGGLRSHIKGMNKSQVSKIKNYDDTGQWQDDRVLTRRSDESVGETETTGPSRAGRVVQLLEGTASAVTDP